MGLFNRRSSSGGGGAIGFDEPFVHPMPAAKRHELTIRLLGWWRGQKLWEKLLIIILCIFLLQVVLIGQPLILTGEGTSMQVNEGGGLRDGGREICIPLRWWPIVEGHIYAFLDREGRLCLKRAKSVDPDGKVFFLGDNRGVDRNGQPESIDSRSFGKISRDRIIAIHVATLPRFFDGETVAEELGKEEPPLTREKLQMSRNQAVLLEARASYFVDSGTPDWRKLNGATIQFGEPAVVLVLPEPCKVASVLYTSSAGAVLICYTDKGEFQRLNGVSLEPQRISAPKGQLIRKVVLSVEKGATSPQKGELKAIRKIE